MNSDRDQIGAALGRIPSGCFILTATHEGVRTGVLLSWVQQAGFEPPSITAAIKRGRPVETLITGSGRFVLNIIGDDPTAMFRHFGRGFTLDEDAFSGLKPLDSPHGPVLTECVGHLACRFVDRWNMGDHDVYRGEVEAASCRPGSQPYVHLRKNGLTY